MNIYAGNGYIMPTLGGWIKVGGFSCALRAQGGEIYILGFHISSKYILENIYLLNIYVGIENIMPTLEIWKTHH